MKVLFIGGTGNISTSVSRMALEKGMDLWLLNRGKRKTTVAGAKIITCDINDEKDAAAKLENHSFDCVVNWVNFVPENIERDIRLFNGKTKQYIFISSASAYQKPPSHPVITEGTPLYNPFWEYSQNKILCEDMLMKAYREMDFPVTIIRPSLTYDSVFPIAIGGWGCYTLADRLLNNRKIIVHGDGSSLWTVTHAEDFARGFTGLIGHRQAIGHGFHITSDEILTWDQIYTFIAEALGVKPDIVHIPSDFINKLYPSMGPGLLGDKTYSVIFDNTKIKSFVPEYRAVIPFSEGIKRTAAWFDEDDRRKVIDDDVNKTMDHIISVFEKAVN